MGNRIAQIGSGVDVLVRAPAVYGAGRVGERALCDEGAWKASLDIGGFAIQWTLDGVDLAGATGGVYTPVAGDQAHSLGCRVSARSASVLGRYSALERRDHRGWRRGRALRSNRRDRIRGRAGHRRGRRRQRRRWLRRNDGQRGSRRSPGRDRLARRRGDGELDRGDPA